MSGTNGHRELLKSFMEQVGPVYLVQGVGSYTIHADGRGSPEAGRILVEEGHVLRVHQRVGEGQYRVVVVSKPDQNLSYRGEPTVAFMQMVKHKLEEREVPLNELPSYTGRGSFLGYEEIPDVTRLNYKSVTVGAGGTYFPDMTDVELLSLKTGWALSRRNKS